MIKKIKFINKFAIFNNFDWDSNVRDKGNNPVEFKKLNIIYGRNYSGKTTLSRIIRSLEEKKLPEKYRDSEFNILTDNQNIAHNDLASNSLDIRVYNSDFIDDNLAFLKNDESEILPFAILGEENIIIEEQISIKENELGSEEKKTGLIFKILEKKEYINNIRNNIKVKEADLETKLKNKANQEIKRNNIYNDVTYNINNIKQDIDLISNSSIIKLSEEQIEEKKSLIKEDIKLDITKVDKFISNYKSLYDNTKIFLEKKIKPTESIQELLNDSLLQEWVRNGISFHKNKRDICAFCGNRIQDNLWDILDAHFSKESENLRESLKKQIEKLEKEKRKSSEILNIDINSFYLINQKIFAENKKKLEDKIEIFNNELNNLIKEIEGREKDIFKTRRIPDFNDLTTEINEIINIINKLIDENNNKTTILQSEQNNARKDLRLNEVAKFIDDIDYYKNKDEIQVLLIEEDKIKKEYDIISIDFEKLKKEIEELYNKLKDEKKGADKINEYLCHFFGNDFIKFDALEVEGEKRFKFQIKRGQEVAYKLSEGERSLVSFCYFIAKLDDINTKNKDLIIWIDDPISSLDNNHIFFIYSLIESIIAKPFKKVDKTNGYNYKQLFISTHNIDFLKYLKRLSIPKIDKKEDLQYFLLERQYNQSKIILMPEYLKKYTTEFNYLFHQIYKCSKKDLFTEEYDIYYNFGNNLRKFLEAYLFYKYPSNKDIVVKLKKFFKDDTSVALTQRIDNELSHLEEIFDRSMKPIEIPEIPKLATYVLNKIKEKDGDQYNALLKSINELEEEE